MSKIFPNEPAMPIQYEEEIGDRGRKITRVYEGLSVRDHFAGLAMVALSQNLQNYPNEVWTERVAKDAVELADALIKELNK